MNMKIEENDGNSSGKNKKKRVIDAKINSKTVSSSIRDLQKKLELISSPVSHDDGASESHSEVSIPAAHKEYEKILRQLEAECRSHIKVE